MAEELYFLKEDGYLNVDSEIKQIVYHPSLNVILICTNEGIVRVLDVNSGVVLQNSNLSAQNGNEIACQYIPELDRVLFCDGQALGVRSDYNGVLLLDTILQKPTCKPKDSVKLELLLSEAIILKQSLTSAAVTGIDDILNELTEKISEAQERLKIGIKAQKWTTLCLELPLEAFRSATNSTVTELIVKNQRTPELGVASAVYERLSELLGEQANASDRRAMASEAKRRETFINWPHMDYKWALPDQMAQAGFYHQPNVSGKDRAMCFTCTVCLVCWERTDEPWSEHERHSPNCPFVLSEYTENVPLSVTYATSPAADITHSYRNMVPVNVLGTSSVPHLFATSNLEGLISVYDVTGKVTRTHSFFVTQFDSHVLEKLTQDFGVPSTWCDNSEIKHPAEKQVTALAIVGEKGGAKTTPQHSNTSTIRPSIICGLNVRFSAKSQTSAEEDMEVLVEQNQQPQASENGRLYFVVYDFQYVKEPVEVTNTLDGSSKYDATDARANSNDFVSLEETENMLLPTTNNNNNNGTENSDIITFISGFKLHNIAKEQGLYQNLIPGESDEIFLPPSTDNPKHSSPRLVDTSGATFDSLQYPMSISPIEKTNSVTISDHIADLKSNSVNKKLNYSRAVQCISIPESYKCAGDAIASHIVPTDDGRHVLVVVQSPSRSSNGLLLMYALDFSGKMVKVVEEPVMARELSSDESPVEVRLLPQLDRTAKDFSETEVSGTVIIVCLDGSIQLADLSTLKTVSVAKMDGEKFVSAVYCNSLERLCASTKKGSLHFYALKDNDSDSVEDHDDEDMLGLSIDSQLAGSHPAESCGSSDMPYYFHESVDDISLEDLKRLQSLCLFEPIKVGYCAVVPPCWSEMQQAQRQRRHPHIQTENEQHTKTWRLQTDTTTWDEHVFELTLPSPTCVGHVDVHFALHGSSALPHVEITLLKQNTNSIGHRKNVKFGVDDAITFEALQWANNNPVTSQEYLRAHKADILAGPIDIATSLDLTDQGGCVTLTSPRLFKSRVRTLLLHIKSVFVKEEGGTRFANATRGRRVPGGATAGGSSLSSTKGEFYMGCDCLQEVSVTVYTVKHVDISNEKMQRSAMLESNVFVQSLAAIVTVGGSFTDRQGRAMDILNWIAAIRMTRNRSCNGEPPNQQMEFLKIVEANLPGLLRQCLLLANRSISHKCAKLMIICSNGARNMNEQIGKRFDSCILSVLLVILESIDRVQSASSLQWIVNLLFKVAQPDQCTHITSKCVSLLSKLSEEIHGRTNPYHLLLRSRYGLYGIPLEPELFDIEPPPSLKATSVAVTYASVVAGDTSAIPSTDFHTNFACNKETLDPKEVLSVSKGENKIKLKNVASTKMIRGLLETEPLHFTCVSASEGTRLERADSNGNNFVNSIIPIPVSGTQPSVNSGTKKVEVETFLSEPEAIYVHNPGKEASNGQGSSNNSNASFFDGFCNMILYTDNLKTDEFSKIKMITDTTWEISVDSDSSSINSETNKPVFGVDQILSPPQTLPWQQLLITPPQQVIVVERMHSGARRFVTLDFGQTVLLTDILIPACHDLVSLSVDVWVKGEDVDAVRLVVASDINTKNLILSDLQPQPLCRYLKITAVGRYGMSTTRCRIPIGSFFGHLVTTHLTNKEHEECQKSTCTELENQLSVLSMLLEDVGCRYSLASTKLKNFLQPFLTSNVSNASHFAAYMSIMKENGSGNSTLGGSEVSKIITAYQEAVTYQRQLNTVRSVMRRIEDMLHPVHSPTAIVKSLNHVISDDKSDGSQPTSKLSSASTDKLCCIVEALLDSLLSIDSTAEIDLDTCQKLFSGLCVAQNSRIQLLGATLLLRSCGKQPFWDSFIADTLKNMFSSSCSYVFPQDRLFVLLAFLGRRSPDRSSVIDATLRVIAEVLAPLAKNRQNLLAVSIDCPLLGWLLLFLSLLLDMNKGILPNATRWDWVTGEIAGKTSDTAGSSYKKKLQKTYLYKQQLKNFDWTQKVCHTSTQALSALSSQAAHLTSKLEAALKQQEHIFKKMKHYKVLKDASKSLTDSDNNGSSKQTKRRREPSQPQENKQWPPLPSQQLDCIHSLVVAKCLISLLLSVDHSCSADMFLLSCKVIARLISLARLRLGQLMNEDHLLKLVKICIGSELPWAPHALACLLQDALEVSKPTSSETDMETDNPSASTWTPSDLLTDVESLCESFILDDGFILSEPASKQGKTTNNNGNSSSANSNANNATVNPSNGSNSVGASGNNNAGGSQLTYVYESDDSELEDFLDDILERGRNLLKRSSKGSHPSLAMSSAMDARLEHNVEMSAEIALRQLTIATTCNLVQNVSAPVPQGELQKETAVWPTRLTTPWQIHPQSSATNRYLLISCFNALFRDLHSQSPANVENVLQLWLTLNCARPDDKFDPSVMPFVGLSGDAVNSLVSAIAWSPGLSLRTWCSALQTLTLVCNMTHNETGTSPGQWSDPYGLYAMTQCIVGHPDFTQMLLRLLSGSGLVFSEKGLAGPSLCKTLHDFLVRLQMRCNVVSPSSRPGSNLKSLLLKVVYQLIQPNGPLAARQGPLDAQCKLLQSMGYLDYSNADLSIVMSIFESTGILAHSYISHVERIKCVNIGERLNPTSHLFSGILASVLGSESNKQDRPVSWDFLLISLLKLQAKLVQTPLPGTNEQSEAMDTEPVVTSQTDESKAEQIQQERSGPAVPCLADTVLQHHPSIIRLCQCLAACKASSLSMLANISQQSTFTDLGEPGTVGDAVFHVLAALAKKASHKELVLEPVLMFLAQAPQLSEPLLWFILQVIDTEDALRSFLNSGGIRILAQSLVQSSNAPNTISHTGTISAVMQHFGSTTRSDASTAIAAASATKKLQQATLENTMSLVNFAPFGTIKCQSGTAQSADVLIQGGAAAHRRARTPQWSYHFYPEEIHTELLIQLPSAILLREVHLQPHLSSLATCPSAVALEVSSDGPSRLVPACPPLPTSGMTFIRFHLPVPEVVNCIQLCLYKPRDANNIGLSQIRILGTSAFGGHFKQLQQMDLSDDESHCKYSLGWLRLLHHCFTLASDSDLKRQVVASAVQVPNLLSVCCGLLIMPTNIPILYLPNLESVLCEMSLHDRENGLNVIRILLNSKPNGNEVFTGVNWGRGAMLVNSAGVQSACELLNQICGHQDSETAFRVALLLEWVKSVCEQAIATAKTDVCNAAYLSSIASILWTTYQSRASYNISSLITLNLFDSLYSLITVVQGSTPLKYALDSLLCSLCYIKLELFPTLLQRMGVLIPNLSTDHGASISDDRKDSESMTDDTKQTFECDSEWYGRLIIGDLSTLNLTESQLETIALVSRSPTTIQQLLDSGLPKLLNTAILQFCSSSYNFAYPMARLENVAAILKFFADVSEEKIMRDWLGSKDGSSFWLPLLQWLCRSAQSKKSNVKSETLTQLEEICIRFLSKCCLCHPNNQAHLAKILCEVIAQQTSGISGFMRRLILQLLLENEKVPVTIKADETIYRNTYYYTPVHPAFKQTHNQAFLYLGTNTTLAEILEQHVSFSTLVDTDVLGGTNGNKRDSTGGKCETSKGWWHMVDSDLSMAAGVTAKDKRAKDAKNQATATPQLKKKRYTNADTATHPNVFEGRVVRCEALPERALPVNMTLGQLLRLIETKGVKTDWPCVRLIISKSTGNEDKNNKNENNPIVCQSSYSSTLQVFSSVGGLALLAQHLPAVYPESIRTTNTKKQISEQSESDWVKLEGSDDIYEDIEETASSSTPSKTTNVVSNVPTHSLTAFGLFLRLPGYAEVLLKDLKKALCLLRLVLGVTDDGEGGDIFQSSIADSLPTLPFEVLRKLYDATPLSTDDGRLLRRISISAGVVHLLLACLGIFTHQTQNLVDKDGNKEKLKEEKPSQLYWAKGTGYGTGSTQQSWNVEQALLKQRSEEEHVTVLLQVLASYINPNGEAGDELSDNVLPPAFYQLLANSALIPALSSYLRNDSVLDMARHIPLYKAALQLLRALAASSQLVSLLLPQKNQNNGPSVSMLLKNMKTCVDTYASKLKTAETHKTSKKFNGKSSSGKYKSKMGEQLEELERDEGLAQLMPDIQATANLVTAVTDRLIDSDNELMDTKIEQPFSASIEERYLSIMKKLQFDTFEMIQELPEGGYKFVVSHHFESNARSAGDQSHPARVKRLAQEAVTLATSLPLSYSSSVFVRCDTDRLDIMKVLITGPADTPYANGCLELDVYFPPDYPLAPMMINLETTGHHTVRFNPNLYNDGKVCLSVLNTWHGRPEEKWNPQTSSFLQVLVSIQSLILVPEPYFNEPGYERSRGTPAGTQSSREYNQNVYQATVRWAMLEQIVNPCPCFRDVIHAHFYLKRDEVIAQVEEWIKDMENSSNEKKSCRNNKRTVMNTLDSFKKTFEQLKEKLMQLEPPEGLTEDVRRTSSTEMATSDSSEAVNTKEDEEEEEEEEEDEEETSQEHHQQLQQDVEEQNEIYGDIDMEKMVNEMCE